MSEGERGSPLPNCELCGDVIGVYEPLAVRTAQGWRMTSVAAEPELAGTELRVRHGDGCARWPATVGDQLVG